MRSPEFPFPKYRDYGPIPDTAQDVDIQGLLRFADWQEKMFKKPIYDDITGYWQFSPTPSSVKAYTTRPMHRTLGEKPSGDEEIDGKRNRMPVHIAESAERAISTFLQVAKMRKAVLGAALDHVSDETLADMDLSDELARYSVEAITDYGYCLENPIDPWVHKENKRDDIESGWLAAKINTFSPNLGRQVLDFGLAALEDKSQLITADGITTMTVAWSEQLRRTATWSGRYSVLVTAYPQIDRSVDAMASLSLDQIFDIQAEFPRVS